MKGGKTAKDIILENQKKAQKEGSHWDKIKKEYPSGLTPEERSKKANSQAYYEAAEKVGIKDAQTFLNSARQWDHPEHEKNRARYVNEFNSNSKAVEKHFIAKSVKDLRAVKNEVRNMAYENNMRNSRVIKTADGGLQCKSLNTLNNADDIATVEKYRALMDSHFEANGQEGAEELSNEFWQDHSLSQ